ncbi:hypothetical protein [Mucilaginibacter sp. UYCu711]|uniref:hypothetical protein n=1 Tax=Mucilaginibacter sp. UYCu711 TaxID=3156339 RepID=UPI003D1B5927
MKSVEKKYFGLFLLFVSFLSPACNHPKQDVAVYYHSYIQHHLVQLGKEHTAILKPGS